MVNMPMPEPEPFLQSRKRHSDSSNSRQRPRSLLTLLGLKRTKPSSMSSSRRDRDIYLDHFGRIKPVSAFSADFWQPGRSDIRFREPYRIVDPRRRVEDVTDRMLPGNLAWDDDVGGLEYGDADYMVASPDYGVRYGGRLGARDPRRGLGKARDGFGTLSFRPKAGTEMRGSVKFGVAMTKLYRQIGKAETLFEDIQSGYDTDVASIVKYAGKSIMSQLWLMKLNLKDEAQIEEGEVEKSGKESLEEWKEKLNTAFQEVFHSILPDSEKNKGRAEGAIRLYQKMLTGHQLVLGLLDAAPKNREDCGALVRELQQLKTLINPEDENNMIVYGDKNDSPAGSTWDGSDSGAKGDAWN